MNEKIDPMSKEGEEILHEVLTPGNNDPVYLETVMHGETQKQGIEWIRARTEQVFTQWQERFDLAHQELLPEDLKTVAREWADLENDYNYIKELNTYVSTRHQEVWDCLPTLQEIDTLIQAIEEHSEEDQTYFSTRTKDKSVAAIKKLRGAIAKSMGAR